MSDGLTQQGRWENRISYLMKQERKLDERVRVLESDMIEAGELLAELSEDITISIDEGPTGRMEDPD